MVHAHVGRNQEDAFGGDLKLNQAGPFASTRIVAQRAKLVAHRCSGTRRKQSMRASRALRIAERAPSVLAEPRRRSEGLQSPNGLHSSPLGKALLHLLLWTRSPVPRLSRAGAEHQPRGNSMARGDWPSQTGPTSVMRGGHECSNHLHRRNLPPNSRSRSRQDLADFMPWLANSSIRHPELTPRLGPLTTVT